MVEFSPATREARVQFPANAFDAFFFLDLTLTFVKKLQAKSLVFLKKWVGLPRCANTAILFVGDRHRPGLKVHNLWTYWKQQQGVKFELLRNSVDPCCRKLHATILARQGSWRKRFAPAVEVACASTVVQANLTTVSRPLHLRGKAWAYQNQPIVRSAHPVLPCASVCLLTFVSLMLRNNWVDSKRFSCRVAGWSGLV